MSKIIVIVDTDLDSVNFIKENLEPENYEVFVASSTEEAIILIEEKMPCLVLIDFEMNLDNDRIPLGDYLLKKDSIPYVYISNETTSPHIEIAKKTRPYGFLMKPIRSFDLTTTVSFILNNFSHRKIDVGREEILIPDIATVAVKKAISYINNNYTNNITLDQLAELTNRDRSYLIRCFKEKLKISPNQYILKLRIDEAMRLIENTDETLLSISKKVGFKSHSNFCQIFKKQIGHTPTNYKYIKSIQKG